jgi:hypothetical protein
VKLVKTSIELPTRRLPALVGRNGQFRLLHRPICPKPLHTCMVQVDIDGLNSRIRMGERLYSVKGGSRARAKGRLGRRALARLRRAGRLRVRATIAIGSEAFLTPGVRAQPSGTSTLLTLLAPR